MTWTPLGAQVRYQPPKVGEAIAYQHGTWLVTSTAPLALTDDDRDRWIAAGMPDLDNWSRTPVRLHLDHLGGHKPDSGDPDEPVRGTLDVRSAVSITWYVYRNGRWPQCSCCGEPMPCRAELQDREVSKSLAVVDKHSRKQDGCCWGCGEPITNRHRSVAYPGDNLDLPGGIEVRFHARSSCSSRAQAYELRWLAVDPRRERILTWPKCGGILYVHADGSSECSTGTTPLGTEAASERDCRGHLTHDHGMRSACYVGTEWFGRSEDRRCARGCTPAGHPGIRTSPRPRRSQAVTP